MQKTLDSTYYIFYQENKLKNINKYIILCPACNAQYAPEEIFTSLLNHDQIIKKDLDTHELIDYDVNNCCQEIYTCDFCDTTFKINARLQFTSFIDSNANFNELYSTKLNPSVIRLDEK